MTKGNLIVFALNGFLTQKWSIESYFDELAENYLQARMPMMMASNRLLI